MRTRTPLAEPNAMLFEYFVDADEAARFLKLNRRTVIRWAREGKIPAHPLWEDAQRKEWRFLISELRDRFLKKVASDRPNRCQRERGKRKRKE